MADRYSTEVGTALVRQLEPVTLGAGLLAPPRLCLVGVALAPHPGKNDDLSGARLCRLALLVPRQTTEFQNQCHRLPLAAGLFCAGRPHLARNAHHPAATLVFDGLRG